MPRLLTLLLFAVTALVIRAQDRELWKVQRAEVVFLSEAPLERITAKNAKVQGLLDPSNRSFAVQIPVAEFEGFNSPLQREHFNENYMDSRAWPKATFEGRVIESVDLNAPGDHAVRAKGSFMVRGRTVERIVPCRLLVGEDGVRVTARFDVALAEHGIRIPKVVQHKVAAVVEVKVDMRFAKSPSEP